MNNLQSRAWIKPLKEMVYLNGYRFPNDKKIILYYKRQDHEVSHEFAKDDVVIQYCIGISDKTGRLIFEGDIKREETEYEDRDIRNYFAAVYLREWGRFAWLHLPAEFYDYERTGMEALDEACQEGFGIFENEKLLTKICGNIYENPDLLHNGVHPLEE